MKRIISPPFRGTSVAGTPNSSIETGGRYIWSVSTSHSQTMLRPAICASSRRRWLLVSSSSARWRSRAPLKISARMASIPSSSALQARGPERLSKLRKPTRPCAAPRGTSTAARMRARRHSSLSAAASAGSWPASSITTGTPRRRWLAVQPNSSTASTGSSSRTAAPPPAIQRPAQRAATPSAARRKSCARSTPTSGPSRSKAYSTPRESCPGGSCRKTRVTSATACSNCTCRRRSRSARMRSVMSMALPSPAGPPSHSISAALNSSQRGSPSLRRMPSSKRAGVASPARRRAREAAAAFWYSGRMRLSGCRSRSSAML